NPE
ncbi:hypothetical protein BVRB_018050, partial [Beta vulgaris subsp. vulgaris]